MVNATSLANDLTSEPIEPLRIEAHVDSSGYLLGEVIEFSLLLRNSGADSITLFHPTSRFDGWWEWVMKLEFLTPAGESKRLVPGLVHASIAMPTVEDFMSLATGEAIEIHFVLNPSDRVIDNYYRALGGKMPWFFEMPRTQEVRQKDSNEVHDEAAIPRPFVYESVFNTTGIYIVRVEYWNQYNWALDDDPETGIIAGLRKFDSSWTGHLSGEFKINILDKFKPQTN